MEVPVTYQSLLVEIKQGVGVIWMNRPERQNALDERMLGELAKAFQSLGDDPGVRIVVIAGAGNGFCAGTDMKILQNLAKKSPDQIRNYAEALAGLLRNISSLSRPTIARVHGFALNSGAGLAAACDMAVGDYGADFALNDVHWGLFPAISSRCLIKAMGERTFRSYSLTGEIFTAAEAYRIGLLTDIVPLEELDARVNELIGKIMQGAPVAQAHLKEWIRETSGLTPATEMENDGTAAFAAACGADEFKKCIHDLSAPRKPRRPAKKETAPAKKTGGKIKKG
jgi:methylglutaconyl-CoA hydratase